MKKFIALICMVLAFAGVTLSCSANVAQEKETGFVSVNASTTQEVSPNMVELSINVETSDKVLQKASLENKLIADKVFSALKSIIGTDKGDYIKTQGYSARPQYTYTKDNKRVFDKYVVSNSVVVKTRNLSIVPKLIDTAIAKGANNVGDLQFMVSDYDSVCSDALASLTKRAYTQASAVAAASGSKIIGIKSISTSCSQEGGSRPMYKMVGAAYDSEAAPNTPIESGKIKIFANVDASFYVK